MSLPVEEVVKKNTSMYAYQILAHIYAGLIMAEVNGELEWIGTSQQHQEAENIINYFETFVV